MSIEQCGEFVCAAATGADVEQIAAVIHDLFLGEQLQARSLECPEVVIC